MWKQSQDKKIKQKWNLRYAFILKFLLYNYWHCDVVLIVFVLPPAWKASLNLTVLQSLFMFPLSVIWLNNTSSSSYLACCALVSQERRKDLLREVFVCYPGFYKSYIWKIMFQISEAVSPFYWKSIVFYLANIICYFHLRVWKNSKIFFISS